MLKYRADIRALIWAFGLFPLALSFHYLWPAYNWQLLPLSMYASFAAAVLTHNHTHNPLFKTRALNRAYANWLSIFYGYPIFSWVPTHNLNHHKYLNGPGDTTITWRHSAENTWFLAATYPLVSAYYQSAQVREYAQRCERQRPDLYRQIRTQRALLVWVHFCCLIAAVALFGVGRGLVTYVTALALPCAFALWVIMLLNYLQHVHCDPASAHNHSRNFVGPLANFLLFNNGYHTVHHDQPSAHWSSLAELHRQRSPLIDSALNQTNIFGFLLRSYLLGWVSKRYRTQQIGNAPGAAQSPVTRPRRSRAPAHLASPLIE